jgi:hypothetical protein
LQQVPDLDAARQTFARSLEMARAQGASAWVLRSAISLHRLDLRNGSAGKSHEQLLLIYRHFREGMDTADLQAARLLVERQQEVEAG